MGVHALDLVGIGDTPVASAKAAAHPLPAPARFDPWPRWAARLAMAVLLLFVAASMIVPVGRPESVKQRDAIVAAKTPKYLGSDERDQDLALYRSAIARIQKGENYYDFIVPEQRARHYPVRPGVAVRLPTLVYIDAFLGSTGQIVAAIALMIGILAAWGKRFAEAPELGRARRYALALVFVGASLGLNRHYFVLHELWAGGLIALALGLHRIGVNGKGGRWLGAFAAGALALAIREHALPFVLLMGAVAVWNRNWKEAAAWAALVAVFFAVLAWHLSIINQQVLPSDPPSSSWMVLRGLSGWLGNIVQSSNLRWLPHWLAGPAVILMTFGWLGWNSKAGTTLFLLSAGYGLAFAIAGRWDNFYWGAMVAPVMFAGLAFVPAALISLAKSARGDEPAAN